MKEVPGRITEEKLRTGVGNRKVKKPGAQDPNMEERGRTTGGRMTEDGDLRIKKLEARSSKLEGREQTTGKRMTEVPGRITEEKLRTGVGNRKVIKPGGQDPNMEERGRTTEGRMTEDGDLKIEKLEARSSKLEGRDRMTGKGNGRTGSVNQLTGGQNQNTKVAEVITGINPVTGEPVRNKHRQSNTYARTNRLSNQYFIL